VVSCCGRSLTAVRWADMSRTTLAGALSDWTDIDVAAHALARSLDIMPSTSVMADAKWVYWSDNPLGRELIVLLNRLVELRLLEKRDEPDLQYRITADFRDTLDIQGVWAMPAPPALDFVVLRCADLERSKLFYESLGLSFKTEQHDSGPVHYSARLGETVLELYPTTKPTMQQRLGLSLPDPSNALARLTEFGDVVLSSDPSRNWALVRDPDGNKIELSPLRT
jgi:lactoylglutathione lyase